jgi:hypothetical protein
VSIIATVLATVAVLVSLLALRHAKRSADASEDSAEAAKSLERQSRTPALTITLDSPAVAPEDRVLYHVRNDGPQDLTAVTIYRPRTRDRVSYPLGLTGTGTGFADDEIVFPLELSAQRTITLCCGGAPKLPEFRVRIVCVAGNDRWDFTQGLPPPRGVPRLPMGPEPGRARILVERARGFFQEAVSRGGRDKSFWQDPERKGIDQEIRDYSDRVGDAWLRSELEGVAAAWAQAFATAPPRRGVRVVNLEQQGPSPADREQRRRLAENEEAARAGEERCGGALAVMNNLEADEP